MATTQDRFNTAIKTIQANGTHVRINFNDTAHSIAKADQTFLDAYNNHTPVLFNKRSQGRGITWREGRPYRTRDNGQAGNILTDYVYLSHHGGRDLSHVRAAKAAFEAQGFTVEWNGRKNRAIRICL